MRNILLFSIVVTIVFCAPVLAYDWSTNPGTGDPNDPYQISTPEQLMSIGSDLNLLGQAFVLTDHIDLSGYDGRDGRPELNGIGIYFGFSGSGDLPFQGVLDGNGFSISNVIGSRPGERSLALIQYLGNTGIVKNLHIDGCQLDGAYYIGAIGAYTEGKITNCSVTGFIDPYGVGGLITGVNNGIITNCNAHLDSRDSLNSINMRGGLVGTNRGTIDRCQVYGHLIGNDRIGGIAGYNASGTISHCLFSGLLIGEKNSGGIVGENRHGTIISCSFEGEVAGDIYNTGGIVGLDSHGVLIQDCQSAGSVQGYNIVGGCVGKSDQSIIVDCWSSGSVTATNQHVGGLVGFHSGGSISGCHATGTVRGVEHVGGLVGSNHGGIHCSYATGDVQGTWRDVGGLIGWHQSWAERCFATGNVSGQFFVGGFAGRDLSALTWNCYSTGDVSGDYWIGGFLADVAQWAEIINCYSTGRVTGNHSLGGFLSRIENNDRATLQGCFWDIESSGITYSVAGDGKTTAEMMQQTTFTGWDFVGEDLNGTEDIWFIREAIHYPKLWWEHHRPIADAGIDQTVYAWINGVADVQLDGTGSKDTDGDVLEYYWYNDANDLIATGGEPNVVLGVGEHVIDLIVNDGVEDSEPNSCVVTVLPAIEMEAKLTPQVLNRKSNRPVVIGRLELAGISAADIDPDAPMVLMPGHIEAYRVDLSGPKKKGESLTMTGFFDNAAVMEAINDNPLPPAGYSPLAGGELSVTIAAKLLTGQWVYGVNVVRVK